MKTIITGDSNLLKQIKINEIIDACSNHNKKILTKNSFVESDFKEFILSKGLFQREKLLIIRELNSFNKNDLNKLFQYIDILNNEIDELIIESDKKNKFIKGIVFDNKFNYNLPNYWEQEKWIDFVKNTAKKLDIIIENDAAENLIELLGKNDIFLYQELIKLKIFTNTDNINYNDIVDICIQHNFPENELICYYSSTKNCEKALNVFKEIYERPNFIAVTFFSYLFNYYYDLYKTLVFSSEHSKRLTWDIIKNISEESKVSANRVRSFLGFNFKNDVIKKTDHRVIYNIQEVKRILNEIEEIDRKVKLSENSQVLFLNLLKIIEGE